MSYVTPCSASMSYSYKVMFTYYDFVDIEMYAQEEYDKALKRHNQALKYNKFINVFGAETIDFEQVQEKRTRHEPVE